MKNYAKSHSNLTDNLIKQNKAKMPVKAVVDYKKWHIISTIYKLFQYNF